MVLTIFLLHDIICSEDGKMSEYGSGRKTAFIVVLALFVIECAAFALLSWSGQTAGKSVAIAVSGLFLAALFFFIHKFLVKNEKLQYKKYSLLKLLVYFLILELYEILFFVNYLLILALVQYQLVINFPN